jgi:hypothetical protein
VRYVVDTVFPTVGEAESPGSLGDLSTTEDIFIGGFDSTLVPSGLVILLFLSFLFALQTSELSEHQFYLGSNWTHCMTVH